MLRNKDVMLLQKKGDKKKHGLSGHKQKSCSVPAGILEDKEWTTFDNSHFTLASDADNSNVILYDAKEANCCSPPEQELLNDYPEMPVTDTPVCGIKGEFNLLTEYDKGTVGSGHLHAARANCFPSLREERCVQSVLSMSFQSTTEDKLISVRCKAKTPNDDNMNSKYSLVGQGDASSPNSLPPTVISMFVLALMAIRYLDEPIEGTNLHAGHASLVRAGTSVVDDVFYTVIIFWILNKVQEVIKRYQREVKSLRSTDFVDICILCMTRKNLDKGKFRKRRRVQSDHSVMSIPAGTYSVIKYLTVPNGPQYEERKASSEGCTAVMVHVVCGVLVFCSLQEFQKRITMKQHNERPLL